MTSESVQFASLAGAFAFLGNTLLAPMNQTEAFGIDPAFWNEFPRSENGEVAHAIEECRAYAADNRASTTEDDMVHQVSVEYTALFIGPPSPAAAPWETFYLHEGATVGFGEPTFEMQRLLREAGLEVSNENNQYADHIGIELLYLSVLCSQGKDAECRAFATAHPLSWIGKLEQLVEEECPDGYYRRILRLAHALLDALVED